MISVSGAGVGGGGGCGVGAGGGVGVGLGVGAGLGVGVGAGLGVGVGLGAGDEAGAVCWMRKGIPAILSVPLRSPAVFTPATNSALPLPVASALTTRTHGTSLDALHLHPASADT